MRSVIACLFVFAVGCAESFPIEPMSDGGLVDSAQNGCECADGVCCDGCHFVPASVRCIDDAPIGPAVCTAYDRIRSPIGDRWCSGVSSGCDGVRMQNGNASIEGQCASVFPDGLPNPTQLMCFGGPNGAECAR